MQSFKKGILVAVACLLLSSVYAEENPYKIAKIGDWIEYTTSIKAGGFDLEGSMRQAITAKTDSEATLEVTMNSPAGPIKQEVKIKLNEPYDARKPMGEEGSEIKELGSGDETITVGGKSLKTHWTKYEVNSKKGPSMTGKAWVCKDVPLGGMVKAEQDIKGVGKQVMELKDFGSK